MKYTDTPRTPDDPGREDRLVRQAVAGDGDAFARLYDDYADRLYRFTLLRVGDAQTAEDLTSQVFLKAWESLSRYQARGLPFGAWLFRIARNTIIDHYRTQKETLPLEASLAINREAPDDIHESVQKQQQAEWLKTALQRLTEDQRQVLTLRFIEDMSTKDTARAVGKREGAIRALQMRGLRALADLIWESDDEV